VHDVVNDGAAVVRSVSGEGAAEIGLEPLRGRRYHQRRGAGEPAKLTQNVTGKPIS
jgi:hypothetical protein